MISIIIPVYNAEKYIERCLDSILSQEYRDIEVICVDDGSEDASLFLLKKYEEKDRRVSVIGLSENSGGFIARKAGALAAKGEFIWFVDADDTIEPGACEYLMEEEKKDRVDILHFGSNIINEKNLDEKLIKNVEGFFDHPVERLIGEDITKSCFLDRTIDFNLWNKVFDAGIVRASLENAEDINIFVASDKYIYLIISSRAASYRGTDRKLYNYHYGVGLTYRDHYSIDEYKRVCSSYLSYKAAEKHVRLTDPEYADELLRNYRKNLFCHCYLLLKNLNEEDVGKGIDLLVDSFGAEYVTDALFVLNKNDSKKIYRIVRDSEKLSGSKDPVRTIGTFYYRLSDGGTERVLSALIRLWASMGYRVVLFTEEEPDEDDYRIPDGITRVVLPSSGKRSDNLLERMSLLKEKLLETGVDTMVFHAWIKEDLLAYLLLCKWSGVRFLIHSHNIFPLLMRHNSHFFAAFPYVYSLADGVVVLSRTDKDYWENFNNNVFQVVNPMRYASVKEIPRSDTHEKTVIWCQRISNEKRPLDAIEVFKYVSSRVPDAKLMLLGRENTPGLERQVREKIREYGLGDRVIMYGYRKDVENYYKRAAVCMVNSEYEGFPLGLMESMGAGVPVVMYELPYLTIAEKGRGVISVPYPDVQKMADRIVDLLNDEEKRTELGRQARESISQILDFDYAGVWKTIFDTIHHAEYKPKQISSLWDALLRYYDMGTKEAQKERDQLYSEKWKTEGELDWFKNENTKLKRKLAEINNGPAKSVETGAVENSTPDERPAEGKSPLRLVRRFFNAILPSSRKNVSWSYQNLTYQLQDHTRMLDLLLADNRELSRRLKEADQKLDRLYEISDGITDEITDEMGRITKSQIDRNTKALSEMLSGLKTDISSEHKEIMTGIGEKADESLFNISAILADHEINIKRSSYNTGDFENDIKCLKKSACDQKILISVIIPVYNAMPYLRECLDSLEGQIFKETEIICIDDGSTDDSLEVLMEYAKEDDRISVYTQNQRGLSVTRNRGVCYSRGRYLYFMDADDILEKDAFERICSAVSADDPEIIFFGAEVFGFDEDEKTAKRIENEKEYLSRYGGYKKNCAGHEFLYEMIIHRDFVAPVWIQLIKRDYFFENKLWFIDGILHEDNPYTFRATVLATSVSIISDKLYHHRILKDSITGRKSSFDNIRGYFTGLLDMYHTLNEIRVSDGERIRFREYLSECREYAVRLYTDLDEDERLRYRELPLDQKQLFEQIFIRDRSLRNINVMALSDKAIKADPMPFVSKMERAGNIDKDLINGALVLSGRDEALELLPKGGICAEIGVAYGDFSQKILDSLEPEHFYAVDLFCLNDIWGRDDFARSGFKHEEYYRERFKELIPDKVSVCRGISWELLSGFEDDFFDYVYIDASHRYEDVSKDLQMAERKVKHGGIIQLNDYTVWDVFNAKPYGVIPAVNEFVNRTGSGVLYYCLNEYGFDDIVIRLNK